MLGESDEDLIEKQALLDSLLEKRAWGERYIANAFPYLVKDITEVNNQDLSAMKKCFMFHYKKYESFKTANENINIPSYESRKSLLMMNESVREMKEIESKEMKKRLHEMVRSEAED